MFECFMFSLLHFMDFSCFLLFVVACFSLFLYPACFALAAWLLFLCFLVHLFGFPGCCVVLECSCCFVFLLFLLFMVLLLPLLFGCPCFFVSCFCSCFLSCCFCFVLCCLALSCLVKRSEGQMGVQRFKRSKAQQVKSSKVQTLTFNISNA